MQYKNTDTRLEDVRYNLPGFPLYLRRGRFSAADGYRCLSHWHDDLEFLYLESGRLCYSVNDAKIELRAGEGIFVNARQLHASCSADSGDCSFFCVLAHPALLCTAPYVEAHYVQPVLEHAALPFLPLRPQEEEEHAVLRLLIRLEGCGGSLFALEAQSLLLQIWAQLFPLLQRRAGGQAPPPAAQHLTLLKEMLRFIYGHYAEKITLAQISRAGHVGKTACCAIFQRYTGETPVSYLTGYRMKKGMELLETTDWTVTEVGYAVGFSSASYFTETFRRHCGCTPREYRARALAARQAARPAEENAPGGCKSGPQQI